jgi:pimeloyl-ACP methyl ester carboxylesterase
VDTEARSHELSAENDDVTLAGTLWLPRGEPAATVLMHPGSGPSDRDNDVFFPPIRKHLVAAGIAVASFDKRGVGGSTGRWQDAAIAEQASDAICCLELLQTEVGGRVGLFGHSQGGWVVLEAAARFPRAAFVITSSGPSVTPEEQERYATQLHMKRAGISEDAIDEARRYYDDIVAMMRAGASLADAKRRVADAAFPRAFATLRLPVLPDDEAEWKLIAALIDYDPRPALERIRMPILAVFGADDPITPVEASVAVLRDAVRPDLLRLEVFAGAGHRLETDEPPRLVDGYLDTLTAFIGGA